MKNNADLIKKEKKKVTDTEGTIEGSFRPQWCPQKKSQTQKNKIKKEKKRSQMITIIL